EDLLKKLNDMRQEYEHIIQKNREEVERWYESKVNDEHADLNCPLQAHLATALYSLYFFFHSQVRSLQSNLEDTERRYNMQLQQIQSMISPLEEELASIRCEMESQNQEYKMLLGIKTRLEQEIAQYRALLQEGQHGIGYVHPD
uniref:IF rod domain-containing protein n=1 Tax=Anas platyrhynchos TaxID=8839 RepID=A0A8B9TXQ0_ANAPL